jgi:putative two-component system response regulator
MAIVDVYDALTNDRPYKKALPHDEAVKIIALGMGTHFDPRVDEIFLQYEADFNDPEIINAIEIKPSHHINTVFTTIANIVDIRRGKNGNHSERMRAYLMIFVKNIMDHPVFKDEIQSWDIEMFLMSAQLHDVGKIAVSDSILDKEGKLTDEEYTHMKSHTEFGIKIIEQIKNTTDDKNLLYHAEALAGNHHERWDGTGYPRGLKGRGIPLQGRIMAIVDVYDALTNNRPHREMYNHEEAVDIIKGLSGLQFDPDLVEVFLEHEKEFKDIS